MRKGTSLEQMFLITIPEKNDFKVFRAIHRVNTDLRISGPFSTFSEWYLKRTLVTVGVNVVLNRFTVLLSHDILYFFVSAEFFFHTILTFYKKINIFVFTRETTLADHICSFLLLFSRNTCFYPITKKKQSLLVFRSVQREKKELKYFWVIAGDISRLKSSNYDVIFQLWRQGTK